MKRAEEHAEEAARLVAMADAAKLGDSRERIMEWLARAQIHATLAVYERLAR